MINNDIFKFKTLSKDKTKCEASLQNIDDSITDIEVPREYKGKIVAIDTPENLEQKVSNNNAVYVTVEDADNKVDNIKDKINGIISIKLIKKNEDGTKQYEITGKTNENLNKTIFNEFAKENITIFEMKKAEATLEDAFMKIIKEGGEN